MKKLNKATRFHVFLFVTIVFLILMGVYQGRIYFTEHEEETVRKKIACSQIEQVDELTRNYFLPKEEFEESNTCLLFYANHKFVKVYNGEELIYSNEGQTSFLGHTTGSVWYFVDVPYGTEDIRVQIRSAYPVVKNEEIIFFQGNGVEMHKELLKESILALFVSGTVIILGIFMSCYWFVMTNRVKVGKALFYLGLFAILLGGWSVGETNVMMLLVENHTLLSFLAFFLLMVMQIPFVQFVYYFMESKDKRLHGTILTLQVGFMALQLVLHFSGMVELKESAVITHVMILLAVAYFCVLVISQYRHNGMTGKVKISLAGFCVLAIATIGDICTYYMGTRMVDAFGRIGFLCFVALLGYEVSSDSLEILEAGRKASIYKELAMKDLLTGTFNRNAYHRDTMNQEFPKDTLVLTIDLNNLKYCNDTFGHAEGDRYIMDSASIIMDVFGKCGNIYRIGGDEFCVLAKPANVRNVEKLIEQMRKEEMRYNAKASHAILALACGYAFFNPEEDRDIEDTRKRADDRMYENKRMTKMKIV